MTELKTKSEHNMIASELLIKEHLHSSSVHCSYYACFQLLQYKMYYSLNLSEKEQSSQISLEGGNTHKYILNKVFDYLKSKPELRREHSNFKREIKDLKLLRTTADYKNIKINFELSDKAHNLAEKLIRFINKEIKNENT